MGCIRHGLHPSGQHGEWPAAASVRIALDGLGCEHYGLHPRRADLIDRIAYDRLLQASAQHGLSTRRLTDPRREDVPEVGLRDRRPNVVVVETGQRATDGSGAQLGCGEMRKTATELSDWSSRVADDDGLVHVP